MCTVSIFDILTSYLLGPAFNTSGPAGHRNKILRSVKGIKKEELEEDVPDEFLCPITRDIMSDPVIAAGWYILYDLSIFLSTLI